MKKSLLIVCILALFHNLIAVENECFSLSKEAKKIIDSQEAKTCFAQQEHKKMYSIFVSEFKHNPEAFSNVQDRIQILNFVKPLNNKVMQLVQTNIDWAITTAFKLDALKKRITRMEAGEEAYDTLKLSHLKKQFEDTFNQKIASYSESQLNNIKHQSIMQAITTIQNLLEQEE